MKGLNLFRVIKEKPDFFDNIPFWNIDPRININTMVTAILRKCGDLELIYTDIDLFKRMSDKYFALIEWNINHLMRTVGIRYNPIYNYDKTETENITHTGNIVESGSGTTADGNTRTYFHYDRKDDRYDIFSLIQTSSTLSAQSDSGTSNIDSVYAYNDTDFSNKTKNGITEYYNSATHGINKKDTTDWEIDKREYRKSGDHSITSTGESSTSDSLERGTGETITKTSQGNIGTTSTQDMIQQEREIALFSIYEWIATEYQNKFCIMKG